MYPNYPGAIIRPIMGYVEKNGKTYAAQMDVEIWGKDLASAEWMALFSGFGDDYGLITCRHEPFKWLPTYN